MRILLSIVVLLLGSPAPASPAGSILSPSGELPEVLEGIDTTGELSAVALNQDGSRAAVGRLLEPEPERSVVDLYEIGREVRSLRFEGRIRSLLFAGDGETVLTLQQNPPKKRRPGDAEIFSIDFARGKSRRVVRASPTATSLALWPAGSSILISGAEEVRTLALPDLRSGPLYRIGGLNLAVTVLGDGSRILIGQPDRLALVDLQDRSGPDTMPVREWAPVQAPVVSLVSDRDGRTALARLADGLVLRVEFDPLRGEPIGQAAAVVALPNPGLPGSPDAEGSSVEERQEAAIAAGAAAAAATQLPTEEDPPDEATSEAAITQTGPGAAPSEEAPQGVAAENRSTEDDAVSGEEQRSAAASDPPAPSEREVTEAGSGVAVDARTPNQGAARGRIEGVAIDRVLAVVLSGPNNLLREARRVEPLGDGSWEATGLEPGRYRIQLDAGGDTVFVTEPRFLTIDVKAGQTSDTQAIRIVRAL